MLARRNSFNAYKVFRWRRLFCEPERGAGTRRLVPVAQVLAADKAVATSIEVKGFNRRKP